MARKRRSERRGSAPRGRARPAGRSAPGGPRARLFLALDLPDAARPGVVRWRDDLVAGRSDLRPLPPEALHVTLVFLGWQNERDVERITDLSADAVAGLPPPALRPSGVRPLPPRAARLFALDLEDPAEVSTAVHAALSEALADAGFYKPEKRPFWPHITLARVKRGVRRARPLEPTDLPPPFEASQVTLYRSTLRPQGAVYDPLKRVCLAPLSPQG